MCGAADISPAKPDTSPNRAQRQISPSYKDPSRSRTVLPPGRYRTARLAHLYLRVKRTRALMNGCPCATRGDREGRGLCWCECLFIGQAPDFLENSRSLTSAPLVCFYVTCTIHISRHMPSSELASHLMSGQSPRG